MPRTFDDVLIDRIGSFSRWHFLFGLSVLPIAFLPLEYFPQLGFIVPHHHCHQPFLSNLSWPLMDTLNFSVPLKTRTMDAPMPGQRFHPCKEYNLDSLHQHLTPSTSLEEALDLRDQLANLTTRSCSNGINFDETTRQVPYSLAEEMELVCDRKYFILVSNIAYVLGMLLGNLLGGLLSDYFGRRKICLASPIGLMVFGISTAFIPNVWAFFILRFFTALSMGILFVAVIIIVSEWSTINQRNIIGVIGKVYLSLVARGWLVLSVYLTSSWRQSYLLYLSCAAPALCGYFIWFESPRWLASRGKIDEAVKTIMNVKRWNNSEQFEEDKVLKDEIVQVLESTNSSDSQNRRLTTALRDSKTRRPLLLMIGIWTLNTITFFGLNLNIVRPTTDVYLVAFLSGVVGLPSCVLQYVSYHYFDRKRPLVFFYFVLSAILLSCLFFLLTGYDTNVVTGIATLGLLVGETIFTMLYVWTPELFPTEVRSIALGLCSASARVGMMIGAGVERLDEFIWIGLPMACFFCTTLFCALMTIFLPAGDGEMKELQGKEKSVSDSQEEVPVSVACSKL